MENKKKYVWATDKYTTSMHDFGGKKFIDKLVVVCDNQKQVDAVVSWMEKEGIYSNINWAPYKPEFKGRKYSVSIMPYSECGAIHRYTGVFPSI